MMIIKAGFRLAETILVQRISSLQIIALCTFLAVTAASTTELDAESSTLISPCPDVFTYTSSPASEVGRRWDGLIRLPNYSTPYSLYADIVLDSEAWLLGNNVGLVTTEDHETFEILNSEFNPGSEEENTMTIIVLYNPLKKVPRLEAIRLRGRTICGKSRGQYNNGMVAVAFKILQSQKSTNPRSPNEQPQCGKVVSNPLVLNKTNDEPTLGTQWPWQIALYQTQNLHHNYICGGTLVTARHTITAAHCVTMRSSKQVLDRYTLAVFLGKHNLWTSIDGVQVQYVQDIHVHPDYNAHTYSRDVAILELYRPLTYTNWIRPACLWPEEETDLNTVIGKKGLLLNWGFDDKGDVIDDLHQEAMPVVSQETCIKSYSKYTQFISEYTYCAGDRQDKASCPSAGSGMVFWNGNSWHLRGLLSLSMPRQNRCDPTHYAVYTDLAKFLPWIKSILFDY